MKKPGGMIGEILEQGGTIVQQTAKSIAQTPSDLAKAAVSQSGLSQGSGGGESGAVSQLGQTNDTKDIVKSLYGIGNVSKTDVANPLQTAQSVNSQAAQTPAEQEKLKDAREKLQQLQSQHKTSYYDPTFNRPRPQEESAVEKIERQDKQKEIELQQKEAKKPKPIAVQRGQESAEKFRGAAG